MLNDVTKVLQDNDNATYSVRGVVMVWTEIWWWRCLECRSAADAPVQTPGWLCLTHLCSQVVCLYYFLIYCSKTPSTIIYVVQFVLHWHTFNYKLKETPIKRLIKLRLTLTTMYYLSCNKVIYTHYCLKSTWWTTR